VSRLLIEGILNGGEEEALCGKLQRGKAFRFRVSAPLPNGIISATDYNPF
jgi:hypothetical protein